MTKLNRKGFISLETFLIVLVLAIIGGAGYFVYQAQNKTKETLDQVSTLTNETASPKEKSDTKTIVIKEWGIKASYKADVDLVYKLTKEGDSSIPSYVYLSSKQLNDAGPMCAEGTFGGAIERYRTNDHVTVGDGEKTAKEFAEGLGIGSYGHAGDFYFIYQGPQAACTDTSQEPQSKTMQAVRAIVPKLEAVKK